MKKKVLCCLICFCLMAGIVNGCGAKDTSASDRTEQIESKTSNESSTVEISSTPEPTIEPTPEPENLSFFDKNHLQFSGPEDLSLPCAGMIIEYPGDPFHWKQETAHLKVRDTPASYHIESLEKSEPDSDGNITYTIRWTVEHVFIVDIADQAWGSFDSYIWFCNYGLFDYYTGTSLNPEEDSSNELDLTWEENTYHIVSTWSTEPAFGEWTENEESMESTDTAEYCYQVTVPADYDGLILYINGAGATYEEYLEKNPEPGFGTTMDDIENADHWICIRVSDCAE